MERITIEIDDAELDAAIAKLKQALSLSQQIGGAQNIQQAQTQLKSAAASAQDAVTQLKTAQAQVGIDFNDLPGINRELRLILGQVPGMREAIQLYFRTKRLMRSIDIGGLQLGLTLLATAILLVNHLMERERKIEQRQRDYESFIMRERGLTHELWLKERDYWMSYLRSSPP